jgi:hypothetical protein
MFAGGWSNWISLDNFCRSFKFEALNQHREVTLGRQKHQGRYKDLKSVEVDVGLQAAF